MITTFVAVRYRDRSGETGGWTRPARRSDAKRRKLHLRTILFNHWYYHRDQLTVYRRALDVPVPAIYGPSADEIPF
jgi:uncharacterized damage-inducible protein DinB